MMSSNSESLFNAHCHTRTGKYCNNFLIFLQVHSENNIVFVVILILIQPFLIAFPKLNRLKFNLELYCTSFKVAFNCFLPNWLHKDSGDIHDATSSHGLTMHANNIHAATFMDIDASSSVICTMDRSS